MLVRGCPLDSFKFYIHARRRSKVTSMSEFGSMTTVWLTPPARIRYFLSLADVDDGGMRRQSVTVASSPLRVGIYGIFWCQKMDFRSNIGGLHENWRPIRPKMTQLLGEVAWSENDILVKNDVINDILVRK